MMPMPDSGRTRRKSTIENYLEHLSVIFLNAPSTDKHAIKAGPSIASDSLLQGECVVLQIGIV